MLDASLDTNERGLGMNSKVSENPTLARGTGLGARGVTSWCITGDFSSAVGGCASAVAGDGILGVNGMGGISGSEDASPSRRPPKSAGLVGALLPRNVLVGTGG